MAKTLMTSDEVIAILKGMQGERTNVAFAEELGISNAHLGEIYKGSRNIGKTVADVLGIEAETMYRKVG
jgi:hypothetical protein